MNQEPSLLDRRIQETKEYLETYHVGFGDDAANEFKRRLNFDVNLHRQLPLDPIELARFKVVADNQPKEKDINPDAIVLKVIVTKDGLRVI